ncbi:OLC1v1000436C1 [Oldenlandia corymbosa var. corymbosa]|uniref:DNA polymerase n=1 Tax=Oldenlandia corymbosa var. corymbosa TaxID=529605 RepID=A0AAV1D5C4_OLDCO|nr:OLC1v1000436C1 [Oldenlandia corymbosa var. corymbosa]
MGDSLEPNSKIFSVRIVSLDYYMSPPIPGFDISYSSFHGGKVNEVPVIRIYGSTPGGQKTCLHVHGALPYLYVPCSELSLQPEEEGIAFTNSMSLAIEKALKLKSSAGSKRQHVHGCSLVRAKKFYGHHSSEELFLKIYLYYPQDVPRLSNLLLAGAILDKILQPHESHIPYLLQFKVDYNLYGMGHLHLTKLKFRHPVPDVYYSRKAVLSVSQADAGGDPCLDSPTWTSSTIPDGWTWQSCQPDTTTVDNKLSVVKRQSTSELEGDAVVEDILNQLYMSYTSLSQTHSEMKMVQSLIPIWEELDRSGGQCLAVPPDPGKPLPQDVLRTLSHWLETEKFLSKLSDVTGNSSSSEQCFRSLTDEVNLINSGDSEHKAKEMLISLEGTSSNGSLPSGNFLGSQDEDVKKICKEPNVKLPSVDQYHCSPSLGPSHMKASDQDALGLLKWLASSQAEEEINSDDELAHQTILSPLLPSSMMNEVLEKANADIENQSQQECQDILDSIDDVAGTEESSGKAGPEQCNLSSNTLHTGTSNHFNNSDSLIAVPDESFSDVKYESESSQNSSLNNFGCKRKKKPEWGHLPVSSSQNKDVVNKFPSTSKGDADIIVGCSMRDLMRKKRCFRNELSDSKVPLVGEVLLKEEARAETYSCREQINYSGRNFHASASSQASVIDKLVGYGSAALEESAKDFDVTSDELDRSMHDKSSLFLENANNLVENISKDRPSPFSQHLHADSSQVKFSASQKCGGKDSSKLLGEFRKDILQKDATVLSRPTLISNESPEKNGSVSNSSSKRQNTWDETDLQIQNLKDMGCLAGHTHQIQVDGRPEEDSNLPETCSSMFPAGSLKADPVELIGFTFCKKPPVIDSTYELGENSAMSCSIALEPPAMKEVAEKISIHNGVPDDVLPFFMKENLEDTELQNISGVAEHSSRQEKFFGVPVHYHNDGSYLYMLTPARSPPSEEHVERWLSSEGRNVLLSDCNAETTVLSTPSKPLRPDVVKSESPLCPVSDPDLLDSGSNGHDKEHSKGEAESHISEVRSIQKDDCKTMASKSSTVLSQDISQLSGPDVKSKLTPLSQMGFRDPAGVAGRQQITMVSVEIHAGCRGDLRPDPRFDAIDIITLVFQEDDGVTSDAFMLLLSDTDKNGQNLDGICNCKLLVFDEEKEMLNHFVKLISLVDPDILIGWDIQAGSLGFLAERAANLGIGLLNNISRTPSQLHRASEFSNNCDKSVADEMFLKPEISHSVKLEDSMVEDEWGRTHASGVHVGGRIVLNVWRLMRGEVKLNMYTLEAVAEAVLKKKVPYIPHNVLTKWFSSGSARARYRCMEYVLEKSKLNLHILNQHDLINRTSELARVFGIDFFSVLSRGSQYRVESMLLRLAHSQNYVAISPGNLQVACQPAMECLPLVMEPESGFYSDPVIVLDFQSLYPSMIIAYNLCFCTCLGKITPSTANVLGVSSYSPDMKVLQSLKHELLLTPNGVLYVPSTVRKGVLPRLLDEILSTRIMVKQAMKKLGPSNQVLHRIFNARQLALKLISNVTYGYTAAGFSGRMPCAELADSIVQCGRRTLENAISFINSHDKWKARVIYGDTDSMFVLLKGRSVEETFQIGDEIASAVTAMNPNPVVLKMEKVYYPCFLLTKKRYVGYSYESPGQRNPKFDAKGIETVRRDSCGAVSKTMEKSLRVFFEHPNIDKVKTYLLRQWTRIISGRISLEDFIFAKEVRLGTYRASSVPPAAIVATKAMRADPRAEPRYGERVPYVVVHGEPGARLVDMVVDPMEVLAIDSPYRLNEVYYIKKQIIPALQRVFGLVGADLNQWFAEMPRPEKVAVGKRHLFASSHNKTRIDSYYLSKHCVLCGALVQAKTYLCLECSRNEATVAIALTGRTAKLEKDIQHLVAVSILSKVC